MYYSAGTYESFARPEKPEGVDRKSAYIIGTGLAGLSAAFYLVRDGQMKGKHIHLLEKLELAGGSCDGRKDITKGFYMDLTTKAMRRQKRTALSYRSTPELRMKKQLRQSRAIR